MLRRTIRAFVEREVMPQVSAWEESGQIPRAFWRRLGELGLYRDVRLWTIASGTSEMMREIIARTLLP
jgi:alkylation response protein AidB-like acyl-CoA dehydrogenase